MCGINGHARADGHPADPGIVARMNARLHHRGPDEGGVAGVGFAAVGMRRLSIVDLGGGSQPMGTPDGRVQLVYNGELYDHAELRRRLEARGASFRTSCDTEVLLHAWLLDGEACLDAINGMYAFAVADRERGELVLARDPLGIKPLYYTVTAAGDLVFSSELTSLLAHPEVPRALDRRSLLALLVDRCVGDPWTMFDGVYQLPPGHLLRWRAGKVEVKRYWRLDLAPRPADEEEALEELRATLDETVRSHLVADVPVGVFLSGGIDSSTVAAYAARALRESGARVKSFSVGFANPDYDESPLAREVARHLGTDHHELRVEDASFDPALQDRIVDHVGQPLGDPSCIPTWLVSRFARDEVKVVLSGDGGDELFGGYDHMFWAARVRRVAENTPSLVRQLGRTVLAGVAPVARGRAARVARRARKGLDLTFCAPLEQLRRMMSLWSEEEALELLADRRGVELRPWLDDAEPARRELAPEEYAMAVLGRTYLPSAILTKVDRMSMAASLEVRVPLLDDRVVGLAQRLPLELKVRGRTGKHLLRRAGMDLLPPSVYSHRKQGFSPPLADWFDASFWDLFEELYRPGSPAAALVDRRALDETLRRARGAGGEEARLSSQAASARVWLLAQLGRWMERFEVAA